MPSKAATCHARLNELCIVRLAGGTAVGNATRLDHGGAMYGSLAYCEESAQLVLFGGRASPRQGSADLSIVNLQQGGEGELSIATSSVARAGDGGCWPAARWRHSGLVVRLEGHSYLVVYGGRDESAVMDDVWLYCLTEGTWSRMEVLSENTPAARFSHAMCAVAGGLFLSGGLAADERPLGDCWKLSLPLGPTGRPAGAVWTRLCCDSITRYSHHAHTMQDGQSVLLLGGVSSSPYNLPVALWQGGKVQSADLEKSLTFMCHNMATVRSEGSIHCLGGGGNCFSFGTHLNKQLLCFSVQ